eukprot:s590_g7.t1
MASGTGTPPLAIEAGALDRGQASSQAASTAVPKAAAQQQSVASPTVGMNTDKLMEVARSAESERRSQARREEVPREALLLLRRIGENKHFWFALRRHADAADCIGILAEMAKDSQWPIAKNSENEVLRKEYLRITSRIREHYPEWTDENP